MHLLPDRGGEADAAGLGQRLESRRHVDAVADDVVAFDDDVAEIDPDPQLDAVVGRDIEIAHAHFPLHLDRAAQGRGGARELEQHAVARRLHGAPAVLRDLRIEDLIAQLAHAGVRAGLVALHEARVPDDVRHDHGDELAAHGHRDPLPCVEPRVDQDFNAARTSSSIFLASPKSMRLLSL